MAPRGDPTDTESQPVTTMSPNSSDTPTNLSDVNDTKDTVSPLGDDDLLNVNGNALSEASDKVPCDNSDNVSPTVDDNIEQCKAKDVSPPSVNTFQLSVENDYVFDLD